MKQLTRDRNRFELYYRQQVGRAILRQIAPILADLRTMPASAVSLYIDPEPIRSVLFDINSRVGVYFSDAYRKKLIGKKDVSEGWRAFFDQFILPILNRRTAERVTAITETTQKLIRESIQRGIADGLGIDKIAGAVRSDMIDSTAWRALMIAQTEVISVSNQSAYEGAESAGIPYKKFWSNSGLDGVRESHIFAQEWSYSQDGIDPNEKFDMGNGNFMMHPGDPEGPPEEIINCRCTLIIEPV
jgi:hypothetical protein